MSKLTVIFLWTGAGLYAVAFRRDWLRNYHIYIAVFISHVLVSPVIVWNGQHDFITINAYSQRIRLAGAMLQPLAFFKRTALVIISNNPVNVLLICLALGWFAKNMTSVSSQYVWLLLCCCIPFIAVFTVCSLSRETLAHWT